MITQSCVVYKSHADSSCFIRTMKVPARLDGEGAIKMDGSLELSIPPFKGQRASFSTQMLTFTKFVPSTYI